MEKQKLTGSEKAAAGCAIPVIGGCAVIGLVAFVLLVSCAIMWKPPV